GRRDGDGQEKAVGIAEVHQRADRNSFGDRPPDFGSGKACRQRPRDACGFAGVTRIFPVGMPAGGDTLMKAYAERYAGLNIFDRCDKFGVNFGLVVFGVYRGGSEKGNCQEDEAPDTRDAGVSQRHYVRVTRSCFMVERCTSLPTIRASGFLDRPYRSSVNVLQLSRIVPRTIVIGIPRRNRTICRRQGQWERSADTSACRHPTTFSSGLPPRHSLSSDMKIASHCALTGVAKIALPHCHVL